MGPVTESSNDIVKIESKWYFGVCLAIAALIGIFTWKNPPSPNLLGIEVLATILILFLFGSIRYRIDKNAITYGALPIIFVTFFPFGGPNPICVKRCLGKGAALWRAIRENLLSIDGLEKLIHGDTMLFILGLTFSSASSPRPACWKR